MSAVIDHKKDIEWILANAHMCEVCCEPVFFADPGGVKFAGTGRDGARKYIVRGVCENCGYDSEMTIELSCG